MYKVVRKLNENTLVDFGAFTTLEEADVQRKIMKEFVGGEILILDEQVFKDI